MECGTWLQMLSKHVQKYLNHQLTLFSFFFLMLWCFSQKCDSESKFDAAHVTQAALSDVDLQSNKNCGKESSKPDSQDLIVSTEENIAHGKNTH